MGDKIDAVSSHHVEGGVGDVYDTGDAEDQRKPDSEKGEYAPTDETAYDDVQKKTHVSSNSNHQIPCLPAGRQAPNNIQLPNSNHQEVFIFSQFGH